MAIAGNRRREVTHHKALSLKGLRRYSGCITAAAAATLALCGFSRHADASTLTWDSAGASSANPLDGPGNWNTSGAVWSNGSSDLVWNNSNNDTAVVGNGGTAGTINLSTGITVGGMIFNPVSSGIYNISGNTLTLGGTGPAVFAMNTSGIVASTIAGSAGLSVIGTGTLTIAQAETYTNGTTIGSGATLQLGNGGSAGNINAGGNIVDNGTLAYNRTDVGAALALSVTGSGGISLVGNGQTVTFNSVLAYTGTTAITRNGTLVIGATGNLNASSSLLMGGGSGGTATLNIATGRSTSIAVSQSTFSAGLDSFVLPTSLGSGDSLSLGSITRNVGSMVNFGTLPTTGTVTTSTPNANFTGGQQTILGGAYLVNMTTGGYSWAVSGSGATAGISGLPFAAMTGVAGGSLTAGADISLSGGNPTTLTTSRNVNSIYWSSGNPSPNVSSPAVLTIATGGLLLGSGEGANNVAINGTGSVTSGNGKDLIITEDSGAGQTFTIGAVLTDNGGTSIGLTAGSVNAQTVNVTLTNANTFTGDTNVNTGGIVTLANPLAVQNSVFNYVTSGSLSFGTLTSATLGGLKGRQSLAMPATLALTIGSSGQSASTTFSGAITGTLTTGSLTKAGAGTLTLTGANTYTVGATNISSGTLALGSGGSLGNTPINVFSSATFAALPGGGSVSAAGILTQSSGSFFSMSGDNALSTLNLSHTGTALSLTGTTLSFDLSNLGTDKLADASAASVSGTNTINIATFGSSLTATATYNLITATGGLGGTFQFSNGQTSENLTVGGTPYTLTLLNSATAEQVSVALAAVTSTWNGASGTTNNWTDGANWVSGAAPTPTFSLIFDGSTRLNPTNDFAANTQFNGLKFLSTAGAFTLSGNAINLGGDVLNQGTNTQTINLGLALQQTTNFSAGTGKLVIGGAVSGTFGVNTLGNSTANSVTLSGSNLYTGTTAVNSGKLILGPTGSLAVTAINVSNGAVFAPQPAMGSFVSAGGSMSLANGSTFDMSGDLSAGAFNLSGAAAIGSAAGTASSLKFDLGTNGGTTVADILAIGGAATVTGTNSISIVGFGSANLSAGTYNLITAASGLGSGFTLATPQVTVNGSTYNLSLINTGTAEELKIFAPTVFATWQATGAGSFAWGSPTTNWSSSPLVPGNPTDSATFGTAAGTNNQTITLDQPNYAVGVLVFNNTLETTGAGDYTIAGDGGSNTTLTMDNFLAAPSITNSNGNNTISANLSLNGSTGISIASGTSLTVSGVVSNGANGAAGLTETGLGTLVLSGSNTYTGSTNLSGGTLVINNSKATGAGTLIIGGGTTIDTTTGVALSNNNAQTWAGSFTFTGTQNLNMGSGAVTLTASPTVTVAANNLTVGGIISGTQSITKAGGGTLTLTGANNYSGGTTISAGTLNINADAALGAVPSSASTNLTFSGNSTLQAGGSSVSLNVNRNVAIGGGVTATFDTNGNNISVAGLVSGATGGVSKINGGTLFLSGANTYGGATNIAGGTISIAHPSALGSGSVTLNNGTTLQIAPPSGSTVTGFGGAGAPGWKLQQGQGAGPATVSSGNVLTITPSANTFTNNAAWDLTKVTYSSGFSASFVYQITGGGASGNGASFTLENSANTPNSGVNGVVGGFGTDLGYGHQQGQADNVVSPSAALGWSTGNTSVTAPGANGVLGTFGGTGSVNLNSGHPILFTVSGTGNSNILSYTITDQTTLSTFSSTANLGSGNSLNALLGGGGNAYVGFTGGSTTPGALQNISNFSYISGFTGTFNASNPVIVNANSTIDLSYAGGATMGTLAIGGSTLTISNQLGTGGTLTMGATTLSGSPTFAPAANTTLGLGALTDGGSPQTITVAASASTGGLTLTANAASLSNGTTFSVTSGVLNSNAATAMGNLPVVNLSNSATFGIGASQTIAQISDGATLNSSTVKLNGNTLTIGGSNNLSSVFNGVISDGTGTVGTGGLTKAGTGSLTLNGSHTFTGATTISAGNLILSSTGSLGNTAITVGNLATFSPVAGTHAGLTGAGSSGATLNLSSGSILNLADGTIGNFNVNQQASFGSGNTALTLSGAMLDFDLGGTSSTATDTLAVNVGTASVSGTNTIAISLASGTTTLATGSYNLITATSGLNSAGAGAFNLASSTIVVGSVTYTLSLGNTGSAETLLVTNGAASSAWTSGDHTSVWADAGNWSNGIPGAIGTTNNSRTVVFNANPTLSSPVVDAGRNVMNVTFDNTSGSLGTLNVSGSALTLTSAGVIQTLPNVVTDQSISAALVLEGNYSVLSNSATNNTLSLGSVSGVNSGTVLTLGGGSTGLNTVRGAVTDGTGTVAITKTGSGTWVLSGSNSFSGGVNLSQGLLNVATGSTGTGSLNFNGGTLQYASGNVDDLSSRINNSTGAVAIDTNGNNVPFAGTIDSTNTGGLSKLGTGTLTLSGANGYSGATLVSGGAINVSNNSGLGSTSGVTVNSGAALQLSGNVSVGSAPLSLNGTGVTASPGGALENVSGSNTYGGTITLASNATIGSDAGTLTLNASNAITGAGTNLTLAGAGNGTISGSITTGAGSLTQNGTGIWALTGSNTYAGGTTLNAGTTQINTAASLGATSGAATINSATLEATTSITTSRSFSLGSSSSTIQVDSGTYSISGSISNGASAGTLNKTGPGQLTLSSANSYTGGTVISGGAISISHPMALGSGAVTLNNATTLQMAPVVGSHVTGSGVAWTTIGGTASVSSGTLNFGFTASDQVDAFWDPTQVTTGSFTTSFVYTAPGGPKIADGVTFTLQNAGTNAHGGDNQSGRAYGYGNNGAGTGPVVTPSVAFVLGAANINGSTGAGGSAIGTGVNDVIASMTNTTGGVNLSNGDPFQVSVSGASGSSSLSFTITDTLHPSQTETGSLPLGSTLGSILGSSTSYVGFTGSVAGGNAGPESISNFSYADGFQGNFNAGNAVVINANSTIDVSYNGGATLGTLSIGSSTLNFTNASGGGSGLTMGAVNLTGNPTFAPATGVQVNLGALNDNGSNSTVTIAGGSRTGVVNLTSAASSFASGSSIQVSSGTLLVSNGTSGSATGNGTVTVASGAFIGGNGTINGAVTVSPGGSLFVGPTNNTLNKSAGSLSIGSGSVLSGSTLMDLTAPSMSDQLIIGGGTGSVNFSGGSLVVTNPNSFTFAGGQTYNLFSFGTETGAFASIMEPTLAGGLSWNNSLLYSSGAISISSSGPSNLTWNNTGGSGNGTSWDVATNQNFNNGSGASVFQNGDNVTFDDTTPSGQYAVTIVGTVSPGSTTFNNSAGNYTVTGTNSSSGIAGTGSLTKFGSGTVTLSSSNSYTGGTTVNGGKLVLASANAFPTNTSLTVANGATVSIANHGSSSPFVPQASALVNTGTIDITNNAMVIHNGSIGAITTQVQSAFNNGAWNGTSAGGIITSSLAAGDSTHLTAVGVATGLTSFQGSGVSASDVLIKYTYYGDANLDGHVDGSDYSRIDSGFLAGSTGWYNGDFNYDGVINGSDYTLIDNAFNTQGVSLAAEVNPSVSIAAEIAGNGGGSSAVPEPTSLMLLGVASLGLLGRRRRRA